ncbi:hypothetical protein [Eggerthella guodeyinii]|uniref:hypothetical protein n=1 Tax=Eggerthella guodeyinii TaxID=2690837 RepID=UPI003144F53B
MFMDDSGSLLLGLVVGIVSVGGVVRTQSFVVMLVPPSLSPGVHPSRQGRLRGSTMRSLTTILKRWSMKPRSLPVSRYLAI